MTNLLNVAHYQTELQLDAVRTVAATETALDGVRSNLDIPTDFLHRMGRLDGHHDRPYLFLTDPRTQLAPRRVAQLNEQQFLSRGDDGGGDDLQPARADFKAVNLDRTAHLCLGEYGQSAFKRITVELCFPLSPVEISHSARSARNEAQREHFSNRKGPNIRFGDTTMAQGTFQNSFLPAMRNALLRTRDAGAGVRLVDAVLRETMLTEPGTAPFKDTWRPVSVDRRVTKILYRALHDELEQHAALRSCTVFMHAVGQKRPVRTPADLGRLTDDLYGLFSVDAIENVCARTHVHARFIL
jgi:hypothetical protein